MKLTDRTVASGASLTDLIHIVITSDTSQNSAGSSFKIPMSAYAPLFGSGSGSEYWTSGSTGSYSIKANNPTGLDATGAYAVAEGNDTLASGDYSHSEGSGTTSSNTGSHAEGYGSIASGFASHAEGINTISSGAYSHAEGQQTTANGNYTHAEGQQTIASSQGAHAEGVSTTASGGWSHAGGRQSISSGVGSFVHGSGSTAAGDYSIVLGNGISGTTNNTTYVEKLNIKTVNNSSNGNTLAVDSTGNVVTGTTPSYILLRITQSGVLAPTFISQKNNLGLVDGDFTFTYVNVGDYEINIANLPSPLADNTTYLFSQTFQGAYITNMFWVSANKIGLTTKVSNTGVVGDNVGDVYIKIEIV